MKLAIGSLLVAGAAAFAPAANSRVSSSALNLAVGETAPDFALVDQNGKTVKRSSFKKPLVVYFYPADSTPDALSRPPSSTNRLRTSARRTALVSRHMFRICGLKKKRRAHQSLLCLPFLYK